MQRLVAELTRPSVLSDRALRQLPRIRDAYDKIYDERHREPTKEKLAERTGLTRDQVASLLAVDRPPRSTEEPLTTEDGVVWGWFEDLLIDPLADGEYERALDAIEAHELVALLSGLSERERTILEDRSPSETAQRLRVSTERVRKIARRARASWPRRPATTPGSRRDECDDR
jgi:RNA polymerase primary sigma factor